MADERARALRTAMTRHEARLWLRLRALRPAGLHVRRQVPVGSYILDFACLRARLGVEIDGEHHGFVGQRRHDATRDAVLAGAGLRVIRFWNHEIDTNIEGVVETIMAAARAGLAVYRSEHPRTAGRR